MAPLRSRLSKRLMTNSRRKAAGSTGWATLAEALEVLREKGKGVERAVLLEPLLLRPPSGVPEDRAGGSRWASGFAAAQFLSRDVRLRLHSPSCRLILGYS